MADSRVISCEDLVRELSKFDYLALGDNSRQATPRNPQIEPSPFLSVFCLHTWRACKAGEAGLTMGTPPLPTGAAQPVASEQRGKRRPRPSDSGFSGTFAAVATLSLNLPQLLRGSRGFCSGYQPSKGSPQRSAPTSKRFPAGT